MTQKITTDKHTMSIIPNPRDMLKNLSTQDFLSFGIQDVAYVKPVDTERGEQYAIHAADGTPLSVMDSAAMAISAIRDNDLEPATVQ